MTPIEWLSEYGRRYPSAWRQAEGFRQARGRELPDWPAWCYMPMAGAYAIVSGGGSNRVPPHLVDDIGIVTALAAWRITKGVYRFDRALLASLWEQPMEETVTKGDLVRLPRWCVYVDLPGREVAGDQVEGAWIHLEHDVRDGHAELRLVLNLGEALRALPIDLGGTLVEGARSVAGEALRVADREGQHLPIVPGMTAALAEMVRPLASVAAYLASSRAEIEPPPVEPREKRGRVYATQTITEHHVS